MGGAAGRDRGDLIAEVDHPADGLGGRQCGLGASVGKAAGEIALTLPERLRMGVDLADLRGVGAGSHNQAVFDRDHQFVANVEVELVDDEVVSFADRSGERVLEGDDGEIGFILSDGLGRGGDAGIRHEFGLGILAGEKHGRLLGEGAGGAEVCDSTD